jgi:hypothetical protein
LTHAGIGPSRSATCGSLVFLNGTIFARAPTSTLSSLDEGAAGIGCGQAARVGSLTIWDGDITTIGSTGGAGIGSGLATSSGTSSVASVAVFGGTINASGRGAASIGSGGAYHYATSHVASLTLYGGTISAETGGAAIGAGEGGHGNSSVGTLSIFDGNITAVGSTGPGIGAGCGSGLGSGQGIGNSSVANLSIFGGNIRASAGNRGAGIGSGTGDYYPGLSHVDRLNIYGGNISATGLSGAGIGSGGTYGPDHSDYGGFTAGVASVRHVTIFGGNINATGLNGAGIGSGYCVGDWSGGAYLGASIVDNLTIFGGHISATGSNGAAAIGGGIGGSHVSFIAILNGSFTLSASSSGIGSASRVTTELTIRDGLFDCGAMERPCFNATTVKFDNGSVTVITNYSSVWSSSQSRKSGDPQLYFEYISNSLPEPLTGISLLHMQSIRLPSPAIYAFKIGQITGNDDGIRRTLFFNSSRSRGCALSLQSTGNNSISFDSAAPELSGRLHHDGDFIFRADQSSDNLYSQADYWLSPTVTPVQSSPMVTASRPPETASIAPPGDSTDTGAGSIVQPTLAGGTSGTLADNAGSGSQATPGVSDSAGAGKAVAPPSDRVFPAGYIASIILLLVAVGALFIKRMTLFALAPLSSESLESSSEGLMN